MSLKDRDDLQFVRNVIETVKIILASHSFDSTSAVWLFGDFRRANEVSSLIIDSAGGRHFSLVKLCFVGVGMEKYAKIEKIGEGNQKCHLNLNVRT